MRFLQAGWNWKGSKVFCGLLLFLMHGAPGTSGESEESSAIPTQEQMYGRIYNGWKWFHVYCFRCHGVDALGSNLAPNLRRSLTALSFDDFMVTVREGRLEKGMQPWKDLLDDDQIADVYYYVRARSDQVLPPGRPDEVGEGGGEWTPGEDWIQRLFTDSEAGEESEGDDES